MPILRRQFLKTAAGLAATPALLAIPVTPATADDPAYDSAPATFPANDPALVKEMVGVSHGNLARVQELLKISPGLAKATWDWGFGDWETSLGAASHVGNREIAHLLMEHGARPDIFTFAMLGSLDVVKAYVAARPGIQRIHGPHGLTLLHHARKGGEPSQPVATWLETLGDADLGYTTTPLADADRTACIGDYSFGSGSADQWKVSLTKDGSLQIKRSPDGTNRLLFHIGNLEFHPTGNPAARIRFELESGQAKDVLVTDAGTTIRATRILG